MLQRLITQLYYVFIGISDALGPLHGITGLTQNGLALTQPISRLPGGGPNSCRCNEDELDISAYLPSTSKCMKRPVCIVFDELDVQHTATQTGFSRDSIIIDRNSAEAVIEQSRRESLFPNRGTQTSYHAALYYNKLFGKKQNKDENRPSDTPSQNADYKRESDRPSQNADYKRESDRPSRNAYYTRESYRLSQNADNKRESDRPSQNADYKRESDRPSKNADYKRESNPPTQNADDIRKSDSRVQIVDYKRESDRPSKNADYKRESNPPTQNADDIRKSDSRVQSVDYKRESDSPKENEGDKKKSDPPKLQQDIDDKKVTDISDGYKTSSHPKRSKKKSNVKAKDLPWQINTNPPKIMQKKSIWRHPLQRLYPKIIVKSQRGIEKEEEERRASEPGKSHRATQYDFEHDDKYCPNCEFMPMFGRQLSRIHFKIDVLEADVEKLQSNIADLKTQNKHEENIENPELKPISEPSNGLIVVCKGNSNTGWETFRIPKGENKNGIFIPNRKAPCQKTSMSFMPSTSKPIHNKTEEIQDGQKRSCVDKGTQNTEAISTCCQTEPEVKSEPNFLPVRKPSSVCQFCLNKEQTVYDNLLNELLKLTDKRSFKSIVLTVLLRADNIYHVNVALRYSNRALGCFLVNHAAIEEAIDQGVFKEILTYSVIDIRNTIKPIGRPFGIPFEFVAKPKGTQSNATKAPRSVVAEDAKILHFITNVLGVHADKIKHS